MPDRESIFITKSNKSEIAQRLQTPHTREGGDFHVNLMVEKAALPFFPHTAGVKGMKGERERKKAKSM